MSGIGAGQALWTTPELQRWDAKMSGQTETAPAGASTPVTRGLDTTQPREPVMPYMKFSPTWTRPVSPAGVSV